jgi:spermidine/putrescine transport system permease protein
VNKLGAQPGQLGTIADRVLNTLFGRYVEAGRLRRALVLHREWVLVGALTLIGLLLRRYHLGVESFWFDEADIVAQAQAPAWQILTDFTKAVFYKGIILAILGQSSFVSAYCLLIFMARLTRFDRAQEEAALDLGASYPQVFWHILLPFLKPAIVSAVVIGFLSSFENYNTTTFAILADKTLVTVLAGQVRQGTTPALSALAVIIIGISLLGAIVYEILKRREQARADRAQRQAKLAERSEVATGELQAATS